jgi:mannose-6-phosphate isomerase-like protein (cupin superfamily)
MRAIPKLNWSNVGGHPISLSTVTGGKNVSSAAKHYDTEESIWFLNSLVKVRRSSSDGPDGVAILEIHAPYGDSPPTHVHHDDDEIFHLIEGRMRFRVGDKEFVLEAGHSAVAPKGIPHTFRVESAEGARVLNITVGPNFENFVREMGRPAASNALPPPSKPSPELIERLTRTGRKHHADIIGPPLAA